MNPIPSPRFLLRTLLVAGTALGAVSLQAEVKVATPFTSHMVLQREMKVPVWGTAEAGENVTVEFAGQKKTATATSDGKWRVDLEVLATSTEGRTMTISGSKTADTIKFDDVLVGEVWLASGQSNMVFPVQAGGPYVLANSAGEIAAANYPLMRMFTANDTKSYGVQTTVRNSGLLSNN